MTTPTDPWSDDCLDRKRFGELLLACLQGEAVFSDEAFVVALTGKFGSGKSHFLRMWRDDLAQKENEQPGAYPLVVTVNAWESDFSGEPLLALVSEISSQLAKTQKGKQDKAIADMKRGVAGVLAGAKRVVADLAIGYVEGQTNLDVEAAVGAITEPADLDRRATILFSDFETRKRSLEGLRKSLGKFIESRSKVEGHGDLKLVLIVDELDRCHPRYAIEFLEAIKHVFNVKGLAVVLGVDWDQLGCTARALFGGGLDVEEYFRKFIKRKVPLPAATSLAVRKLSSRLARRYFRSELPGSDSWTAIGGTGTEKQVSAIFHGLNLTPRQFEGAFHFLSCYYQLDEKETWGNPSRGTYLHEFFLSGLSIAHPKIFKLIEIGADTKAIIEQIRSLGLADTLNGLGLKGDKFEGSLVGALRTNANYEILGKITSDAGYVTGSEMDSEARLRVFTEALNRCHGHDPAVLPNLARKMSQLDIFEA